MKRFVEILLFPILAFSSLIMLFHEFRPMLWRNCVRPAVCLMRSCRSHCYISKGRCTDRVNPNFKSLVHSFDKEIKTILRLIRLKSEEVTEKSSRNNSTIVTIKKESTVPTPYSFFVLPVAYERLL